MNDSESLALFGTTQAVASSRRLVAGPLACRLCEGSVRDVRWHGAEIVRGISYLLRDRDWGTVPARVGELHVTEGADSFVARFELQMTTPDGHLNATACLQGGADGRLIFEVLAMPDAALATNRCGFVVLHPAAAAGRELTVEHTNGRISRTGFPLEISPAQPVFDIRSLSYSPAEGVELQCRLQAELPGDPAGKFEMEDQRNWSDASFKTYVASLLDPWPYVLPAGRRLKQRVGLSVRGVPSGLAAHEDVTNVVKIGAAGTTRMPAIGVGVPSGLHRASAPEVTALRDLGVGWWVVEAVLHDPMLPLDLAAVVRHRAGVAAQVQLDVIVPETLAPPDAATHVASLCTAAGLTIEAVRLLPAPYLKSFQPTDRWPDLPPLDEYARAARAHFPGARVGGGMFTYFTELNRKRPPADGLDFVGHATCPIVHAADDESVMQTVEALPHIVHSVRSVWPTLGYRLGPSSIAARRNPYGAAPADNPRAERIALAAVDPRHRARFGAAWTVGYAAAVAPSGLEMLALHDSHGASGPFAAAAGWPAHDDSAPVPAWSVLATLARAAGARWVPIENLPADVAGMAWSPDGVTIEGLVANLSTAPCRLRWAEAVRVDGQEACTEVTLAALQTINFVLARTPG